MKKPTYTDYCSFTDKP